MVSHPQKHLLAAHEAGVLVPAVQRWAQHPVTLPAAVLAGAALAVLTVLQLVRRRTQPIYLLDFECFRPGGWEGRVEQRRAREGLGSQLVWQAPTCWRIQFGQGSIFNCT